MCDRNEIASVGTEVKFISACILMKGIKHQLNNEDGIYLMDDLKKEYYSLKCYFTIYSNGAPGSSGERRRSHILHYLKIAEYIYISLLKNIRKLCFQYRGTSKYSAEFPSR